jgi:hypothetical protein
MSKTVKTIQTAYRAIETSDKSTEILSNIAVHRSVISTTESGEKYVNENTCKDKKVSKLASYRQKYNGSRK